jgi:hypothetical protein
MVTTGHISYDSDMIVGQPKPHDWDNEICSLDAELELTAHTKDDRKLAACMATMMRELRKLAADIVYQTAAREHPRGNRAATTSVVLRGVRNGR